MTERVLRVRSVIGTGHPADILFCIPLILQHGYPSNCCFGVALDGEPCKRAVQRLMVLHEPVDGHELLSACERHWQALNVSAPEEPAARD